MGKQVLRPLEFGDLLDETFDLYKRHFLLFAGIAAVLTLPMYLLTYSFGQTAAMVLSFLLLPLSYVVSAASTWAVAQVYLGDTTNIMSSYRAVGRRFGRLVVTLLLAGLLLLAGYVPIIIGVALTAAGAALTPVLAIVGVVVVLLGVFLLVWFFFWVAFTSQVVMIEGRSGVDAIMRSKSLIAGNYGRLFIVSLLIGILSLIIQTAFTFPFGGLNAFSPGAGAPTGPLYGLAAGLAATLTTPIGAIAFVLLYYDIRVRKEGFDLELLAQSIGESVPGSSPAEEEPRQV